jgi:general L-amino acid transport system substrate-binding protein
MKTFLKSVALGVTFAAVAVAGASAQTLAQVKARGTLQCGSNTGLAGFGQPDAQGNWTGLDVDFCRAVAAAVFNDVSKVKFVPLSAKDRFPALQSGEIDLLSRNTTWTMSRDAGFEFGPVTYYDGQGFLVRKKMKIGSAMELSGASICVQQGTTTELNIADYFRAKNMKYEIVSFAQLDEVSKAYDSGRCDSFSSDASQLYAIRLRLANPEEHVVLPEVISKEPLGPMWRQGDSQWGDVIKWTHYAMLTAEELGVTKVNVDEMLKSTNPDVKRLLGTEGNFGEQIGLTKDWGYRIIKLVGNYGEVFEKNVGQGSSLKIARGINGLWNKGGVQYAPPVR